MPLQGGTKKGCAEVTVVGAVDPSKRAASNSRAPSNHFLSGRALDDTRGVEERPGAPGKGTFVWNAARAGGPVVADPHPMQMPRRRESMRERGARKSKRRVMTTRVRVPGELNEGPLRELRCLPRDRDARGRSTRLFLRVNVYARNSFSFPSSLSLFVHLNIRLKVSFDFLIDFDLNSNDHRPNR